MDQSDFNQDDWQYRQMVEAITDYAIFRLDADGRVASWNPGAQRFKGYQPAEILGQHFSRFYTPEDLAAGLPQQALKMAAREGRFENEGWRLRKDGSRFWAHVIIDPIFSSTGQLEGYAKVTRDLTERMEAQKDLKLAREALFQSQKLEAIGHLTGGIAHDFNNLLAAVLGSLELVKKRLDFDPRISPLIDNAVMGAQRGAALTQRMLAFARKQELKLEPVDVAIRVEGMIDFIARTIGSEIDIETDLPAGLPQVMSDPNQLEAAVLNLAVNARDAMPDGGRLRISARPEPGGAHVRLSLSDTGEGMDADTVAKAADPFFTTKGVGKGTGLGLSMVHGLMIQCGGKLEIRSEPGQGTVVDLLMPVAVQDETIRVRDPGGDLPDWTRNLSGLRVLAVDDDPLVLTNTAALLEDLGCQVLVASSGSQALELLGSEVKPDLMITDQAMPNMSGVELGLAVRELRLDLPIILATGFAELPTPNPTQYRLQKPFSQGELEKAILDVIRIPLSLPA